MDDRVWMRVALRAARRALALGEVPVGAVVVRGDQRLACGWNLRETLRDPLAHAETLALRRAARRVGDWRLDGADLYVTVEPCPMCAGALLQARIRRLVYGTANPRAGCAGSRLNLVDYPGMDHQIQVRSGVLEARCRALLQRFFQDRRIAQDPDMERWQSPVECTRLEIEQGG